MELAGQRHRARAADARRHADQRGAQRAARAASASTNCATLLDGLREADQRKTEFLATLAHELRNPLAPLSTGAGILRSAAPTPNHGQRATTR